ncbi:serine/threonine-protein kinase [Streptomyces sp. NPDC057456]|uniref:serine/threonine-protein kinase n=1 Tax=Streptomyces sp. NPDC057456 TaxID=3346139 RepID=UPI0036778359
MTNWLAPGFTEIRELGVGTTGRTTLARDDETGDLVAIKYLSAHLTDDTAVAERIRRETALVTGVRDPNVVRIDAVLDSPGGEDVALVMEAVDGPTLRALLAARRLLPEAALALFRGSLLGLAVLHGQGVMHRDVMPDNVLIDAARQGKLINIGIPVPADEDAAEGTAAYRAPELWHGRPASPGSDMYAAAVTFVECLTGVTPFRADSTDELRALHESAPPPLDDVPEPLRPLLERALSKDPRERYSDARAFAADLETAAAAAYGPGWLEQGVLALTDAAVVMTSPLLPDAGTGSAARRPGWARLDTRRRKVLAAVAGAVVVLLLALLLVDGGIGEPATVRKPFDQALAALAKSPGVWYQDQKLYGAYFDATVTATGEKHGTMGGSKDASGKTDQAFMTIGGRDYTSFKNDPDFREWTYNPVEDQKHTAPALKPYLTPAELAATLKKALGWQPRLPEVGDKKAAAVTVNGTRAWKADTVNGFIYVTQSAPHRLLRWEPPGVDTLHGTLKGATAMPQLPRSIEAKTPLSDSRGMDVTPVTDAGSLYATVIENTKALADATTGYSVGIVQQNSGASGVSCSSSGCHVNVAFSGPVSNSTAKVYALDTVYVELTVGSITIGGQQVGGCTSGRQPYELTGKTLTGKLTCDNPDAGAAYDAASAASQDRANASGHDSFWAMADDIDLVVHPLSNAEVVRLVAKVQSELQSFD